VRHTRARPWVSATYHPGEPLSVSVRGQAEIVALRDPEHAELELRRTQCGPSWNEWTAETVVYARILAERMSTFWLDPGGQPDPEATD
jgi:hypothetical protein